VGSSFATGNLTVIAPVKISKIILRDFRAFPNSSETCEFDLGQEGKNLLLFGENGSGKSSLFHALRLLLNEQPPPKPFDDYRHVFTKGNDGAVTVTLTAGAVPDFTWNQGAGHPARSGGGRPFFDFARRSTFLDYKALLKTSLLQEDEDHVNLFRLLVESLLRNAEMPDGRTVLKRWQETQHFIPKPLPVREADESESDYQEAVKEWPKPEQQVNEEAKGFRDQLNDLLNAATVGIVSRANALLSKLASGLVLKLKVSELQLLKMSGDHTTGTHAFKGNDIALSCDYCGYPVEHPPQFLNEARLTAMALALYFAGAEASTPKVSVGGAARLLVLDDVLIGLDLSNRIPVLRLLEEEFKDWQVLLLTYDRVWFDLAQEYTEQTKRWTYLKLLELPTTPGGYSLPLIEPHKSLLQVAEKHLTDSDLMAAAVYVRAAFETRIRNVCRDYGVEIAYKSDPRDVKADKLWQGIVARQMKRQTDGKPDFIAPALMQDVETVRSTVLNRLSHSGSPTLVKSEVKFALDTMKSLAQHTFTKIP
jgi:energy-coupling factor transporter ATP-binding protein EcfA2